MVRFAPTAARRAASLEAHREAAAHYGQVMRRAEWFSLGELADLLDEYARECHLTALHEKARDALVKAIEIRGEIGGDERLGASLCLLADIHWYLGRGEEAEEAVARAVATLENLPPGTELAQAYAQRSKPAMMDFRAEEVIAWGDRAVELARRLNDTGVLAQTLISAGLARWQLGHADSGLLVEALLVAKADGLTDEASRAYVNLANGHTNVMQYAQAGRYIAEGLAYCEEHDLIARSNYLVVTRAWWHQEQGRWSVAERDARRLLGTSDVTQVRALSILGLIQARRGDAEAERTLAEPAARRRVRLVARRRRPWHRRLCRAWPRTGHPSGRHRRLAGGRRPFLHLGRRRVHSCSPMW